MASVRKYLNTLSKTHLVIPDQHADPRFSNVRADWLGRFIAELKPEVVINIGDAADMSSLSSYDKGKRSFHGRTYKADIDAHLEFQDRLWSPMKALKKKMPYSVVLEGNHEHRIERALDLSPELQGTISFNDYAFNDYYDEVIRYEGGTPGIIKLDGVNYAHYFVSGLMGRPIGGVHPAYSLVAAQLESCVCGHSHLADFAIRTRPDGTRVMGVVAGVYQDYVSPWAGKHISNLWWPGVVVLHNVENGQFEPQFVAIETLKRIYG
jgi:Calcineurin-like phosphoesterase